MPNNKACYVSRAIFCCTYVRKITFDYHGTRIGISKRLLYILQWWWLSRDKEQVPYIWIDYKTPGEYAAAALDEPVVHLVISFSHFPFRGMKLTRDIQERYLQQQQNIIFKNLVISFSQFPFSGMQLTRDIQDRYLQQQKTQKIQDISLHLKKVKNYIQWLNSFMIWSNLAHLLTKVTGIRHWGETAKKIKVKRSF